MRVFIASAASGAFLREALAARDVLKKCGADVVWTSSENMHFTFHFLGEIPQERVSALEDTLKRAVAGEKSFEVVYKGIDCFPSARNSRVIWAAAEDNSGAMSRIHGSIGGERGRAGFGAEERQFVPHVTLGRVKSAKNMDVLRGKIIELTNTCNKAVLKINSVEIMSSVLRPNGPEYSVLHSLELGG